MSDPDDPPFDPPPTIRHERLNTTFSGRTGRFPDTGLWDVWQFRGIKYGDIPARFQQATLHEQFPEVYECSAFGPKCPQIVGPKRIEEVLLGIVPSRGHTQNAPDIFDEFECLNLNITTPPNSSEGDDRAVMVYIHGGNGLTGSNSDWFCDGSSLAGRSINLQDTQVITVSINYRLSALGHLGSSELKQKNGEANGGNFAFQDMHLAIEWVRRNIRPFGGSPDRIAVYGQGFGSLGAEAQIHSLLPPNFSRCMLHSQVLGAPYFTSPETLATKSTVYARVKERLAANTVKQLQGVPWQDLLTAFEASDPRAGLPMVPMIDDVFFGEDWKNRFTFAPKGHKVHVLISNTASEGSVIAAALDSLDSPSSPPVAKDLIASLQAIIGEAKFGLVQSLYGIKDSPEVSSLQLKANVLTLIEDMMFYQPSAQTTTRFSKAGTVFPVSFSHPNPFPGPYHGVVHHGLDLAYLHGDPIIFNDTPNHFDEEQLQYVMLAKWIQFACGYDPWDSTKVMTWSLGATWDEIEMEKYLEIRRSDRWKGWEAWSEGEKEGVGKLLWDHFRQMGGVKT